VQGQGAPEDADGIRQTELVSAFLAASRNGDFSALLAILDPDVVLLADETAVKMGMSAQTRGPQGVLTFSKYAGGALPALVNGAAGAVWMVGGRPRVAYSFAISGDKIIRIELIGSPERLRQMDLVIPEDH
jgi:RNA polymerase sigma-70 factor (ECF subfamily)